MSRVETNKSSFCSPKMLWYIHDLTISRISYYMINVLFICSKNQWRSPTAEKIWSKHPNMNVRSAGTQANARKTVTFDDIQWADIIMVMEQKHKSQLQAKFMLDDKTIHVLDIPDNYHYMDPELISELHACVIPLLGFE